MTLAVDRAKPQYKQHKKKIIRLCVVGGKHMSIENINEFERDLCSTLKSYNPLCPLKFNDLSNLRTSDLFPNNIFFLIKSEVTYYFPIRLYFKQS